MWRLKKSRLTKTNNKNKNTKKNEKPQPTVICQVCGRQHKSDKFGKTWTFDDRGTPVCLSCLDRKV